MVIELPDEIEALARQLAQSKGTSVEEAIGRAVEESARAAGVLIPASRKGWRSPEEIASRIAGMKRIAAEITALPLLDPRSPAEIMDDLNEL